MLDNYKLTKIALIGIEPIKYKRFNKFAAPKYYAVQGR